jgi:hypothetical protein
MDIETHVGCVDKSITIFAHRNDEKLWKETASMFSGVISSNVFYDLPILFIVNGTQFNFNTGSKILPCVFERNVNVYHNNCVIRQATPHNDSQSNLFKGVLNYPVELVLSIPIDQTIRIKGFWKEQIFHITALSNYPIH